MNDKVSTIRDVGCRTKHRKVTGGCPGRFSYGEIGRTVEEHRACTGDLFYTPLAAAPDKALIHVQ